MFGVVLKQRSWLLHQHALEAFSQFAEVPRRLGSCDKCLESHCLQLCAQPPRAVLVFEVTNHEEVISQSLCDEETKTKVVAYLSKVLADRWL